MYNVHPNFEACFQKEKKAFQHHSWLQIIFWKNTVAIDVLYVNRCTPHVDYTCTGMLIGVLFGAD